MRVLVAGLLLLTAVVAAIAAVVVGSYAVLVGGIGYAVAASLVSARLLNEETARVRRDWAHDRAATAQRNARQAEVRARDQVAFADHMAAAVKAGREQVELLRVELERATSSLTEVEAARTAAVTRGEATAAELADVESTLETTRAEVRQLRDELTASQAAELEARTELLAWEQSDSSRKYA